VKWINALTFQLFRPNFKAFDQISSLVNEEFCHSLDQSGHFVFITDYHFICQSGSSCIGKHKNASSVEYCVCIVKSNNISRFFCCADLWSKHNAFQLCSLL